MSTRVSVLIVGLLAIIWLCGCGGGGGGAVDGMGSLHFSVKFPALPEGVVMPEYLPPSLMSLVIEVLDANTDLPKCDPIVVNRTSPGEEVINVTIDAIHIGPTKLIIRGYSGLDGTGTIICDANAEVTVQPNIAIDVNMTMATTVVRIVVNGADSVLVGDTTQLTATGYDVDDNIVLSASFIWTPLDDTIADVDADGLVSGIARGATGIKVEEAKKIAAAVTHNIAVNPNIDRVTIETVGDPYVVPAGTPAGPSTTINVLQYQNILVKCFTGAVEIANVPITLTSGDATVVSVSQSGTGSPEGKIYGVKEGGPVRVTATQPYTSAQGTLDVTVTALGDINVHID